MKFVWFQRAGYPRALLFFAGWAMDERPFRRLKIGAYDVCVCFDYRNVDAVLAKQFSSGTDQHEHEAKEQEEGFAALKAYKKITVIAWSFGCAVAAHIMAQASWSIHGAVAINGTVVPEHDELGIPTRWLDATAGNMLRGGWPKFVRRMCSEASARADFQEHSPQRDLVGAAAELDALRRLNAPRSCNFRRALVGSEDRVILPRNQRRCWEQYGITARTISAPHYPFHLWNSWEDLLDA